MLSTLRYSSREATRDCLYRTAPTVVRPKKGHFQWDQLPDLPLDHILGYLRTDGNCEDLAALRRVNYHLRTAVDDFMCRPANRPALGCARIGREKRTSGHHCKLMVRLRLFPSNLPWYDLSEVDWRRVKRSSCVVRKEKFLTMTFALGSLANPVITQLRPLFHSAPLLLGVSINAISTLTDLFFVGELLRTSTIRIVQFRFKSWLRLWDAVGEDIMRIIRQSSVRGCYIKTSSIRLTDPAAYIAALDAALPAGLLLRLPRGQTFFGLSLAFWERLLNRKREAQRGRVAVNGEWHEAYDAAPLSITDDLRMVEWSNSPFFQHSLNAVSY